MSNHEKNNELAQMREVLVTVINDYANQTATHYQDAKQAVAIAVIRKRQLAAMIESIGMTAAEMHYGAQAIHLEATADPTTDDAKLIEAANRLIDAQYDCSKTDGRDAVGFFRTLFARVGGTLQSQFEESRV